MILNPAMAKGIVAKRIEKIIHFIVRLFLIPLIISSLHPARNGLIRIEESSTLSQL
jgi:hypothetical protein